METREYFIRLEEPFNERIKDFFGYKFISIKKVGILDPKEIIVETKHSLLYLNATRHVKEAILSSEVNIIKELYEDGA